MKRALLTNILLFAILLADAQQPQQSSQSGSRTYKVMSFNIRMSGFSERDGINAWSNRKEAVINMIHDVDADFFGVQEMLPDQKQYLHKHLKEYGMVGVGRDDGKNEGECMAVFYKKKDFKLLNSRTFWLSENPAAVSRGWDAACKRTLTYACLQDKNNNEIIYYFNTHLDHVGKVARQESVKLICHIIDSICPQKQLFPVILSGDMNSTIEDDIFRPLEKHGLMPSRNNAPKTSTLDTYNAYDSTGKFVTNKGEHVIDHFFNSAGIRLVEFQTNTKDYGVPFISDHYPIILTFIVQNHK